MRNCCSQCSGGTVSEQEKGFWVKPRWCKVVAPTRDVNLGNPTW